MEIDVVDALADIGYDGPLTDSAVFQEALEGGPKSPMYTGLVHYLSEELRLLCKLEESVNRTNRPDESSHFLLEVSSFLKELGCPYVSLVSGHMSSRLQCTCDRVLLLDYLLAELMAARMLAVDKPEDDSLTMEVTIDETSTAKDLKDILDALKMTQPPANISPALLFQKLKEKLKIVLQKEGPDFTGRPLYNQSLTEKQWKEVEELHKQKLDEFRLRREMLITRLDCTIQSFEWKGKESVRNEDIQRVYKPLRQRMLVQPEVKLSDFLAARSSMLAVKKTSDAAVRINTKSDINNYIIGRVPDRGGRPSEQQAPPPEMPSWQQDRSQGGGRGRGGGGRGSDRGGGRGASGFGGQGGRVQGGWSQPSGDQRYSAGANRGGGNQGFQQDNQGGNNRGGYNGNRGGRGGYNEGVVAADAYDDRNRGGSGFNDRNRGSGGGGYNDRNRSSGGYSDGNRGGYSDGNRGGYNDGNRSGYNDGNRGGYNEGSRSGFQGPKPVHHQRQSQSSGFHNQNRIPTYEEENQGYQSHSQGRYQNEHDDRTSSSYRGSMRGRSSYNRGGRN